MRETLAKLIVLGTVVVIGAMVLLFGWNQQSRMSRLSEQLDPQAWANMYPLHYQSYLRSVEATAGTPEDKLAANPFRQRAWAGHAFALEYNATRAHHYAQIDQRESRRTRERDQPAGCIHCHAAEAPQLIAEYGWQGLHAMRYDDLRDRVHLGSSCMDCHAADTMELRITRPAFAKAMEARGIDLERASRQDMRSYVCAQCHTEYYFRGQGNELVLPWAEGLGLEDMERYYDDIGFSDWQHAETGAGMIKIQHPEFELYSSGIHAELDVSCADCHMANTHEGGMQITEHWIRSPMEQLESACMGCHRGSADRLAERTANIQQNTRSQLANVESAISDLMDAIVAAQEGGATDAQLEEARRAHRRSQMRWDFIDAENSTGFHASREASRILSDAVEMARNGENNAREAGQ